MEMKDFIKKLKTTKSIHKDTGFFDVKVRSNLEHTKFILHRDEKCRECGSNKSKNVIVEFFKPQKLTIFEAEMLFSLYSLNRKPHDYACFHKCIAGGEFIKNIKTVTVSF